MTQHERILDYMRTHNGITVNECTQNLGCTELRKRISELIIGGVNIQKIWERGRDRYGMPTRYIRYYLIED
jgi:hypothetical protein